MLRFIRRSLRLKVMSVVLATTLAALLAAAAALVTYDARAYKQQWVTDLATQAEILARVSAPALAFDDPRSAEANLALLKVRPEILGASIYSAEGKLFASYSQDAAVSSFPSAPLEPGYRISNDELSYSHRISENDETVGTVFLRARYQPLARLADYLTIIGVVMVASLLLAVLISARLQAAVTTPILAVTNVARRVMNDRHFALHVEKSTEDEIGVLVDVFNGMLAEVGQRASALEESNRNLQAEMAERKNAETALRAADQRKDEFLATLAHELRNPLAPIRQAARVGGSPHATPAQQKWSRDIIDRQIQHMALLLDDLLDVSRISRGRLELRKERTHLASVVAAAVETSRPLMEAKHHELTVELPAETTELTVDSLRLAQVLSNLLTNAAKYTDPRGHIWLIATLAPGELTIRVRDNGIGLSTESLPKIFAMFSQVTSVLDRAEGGLGIGLALSKGLVELHDGRVEVHSAGLGKGSEFIVRLPWDGRMELTASIDANDDRKSSLAGCRVLIADDNKDAAESLALLLRFEGNEVRTAFDGEEALDMAEQFRPDLAILDIGMPALSGYDVARRIRSTPWGRSMTLVALTGWGQADDRNRARDAGFDHHFTKPIDPNQLREWLATATEKRGSTERRA